MSESTLSSSSTTLSFTYLLESLWRGSVGMFVGIVTIVGGMLYWKQDSLLYMPVVAGIPRYNRDNPRGYQSPAERAGMTFEELRIPCSDGIVIHAWLLLYTGPSTSTTTSTSTTAPFSQSLQQQPTSPPQRLPTILFFHGNAGNIGMRLPNAIPMMQHLQCHVLLVEYRGYGDSDDVSIINEKGLQQDAIAVLDYVRSSSSLQSSPYIDSSQIYLYGQSLGGAVAFFLANHAVQHEIPGILGIMVENTFTSISDMVNVIFPPFLAPIKHLILRIGWNSAAIVPNIVRQGRIPILFLAGAKDQLVPHQHMLKLHQLGLQQAEAMTEAEAEAAAVTASSSSSSSCKQEPAAATAAMMMVQMHIVPNGTHNETWYQGGRPYWKAMVHFVQQTRALQKAAATATARSDSTASASSSSSSLPAAANGNDTMIPIPTMSTRLLDIAKETITGHGVVAAAAVSTSSTAEKKKKNM